MNVTPIVKQCPLVLSFRIIQSTKPQHHSKKTEAKTMLNSKPDKIPLFSMLYGQTSPYQNAPIHTHTMSSSPERHVITYWNKTTSTNILQQSRHHVCPESRSLTRTSSGVPRSSRLAHPSFLTWNHEEKADPGFWFPDLNAGMAFCTLYYGNGLLEDHPDRWPGRFIHYQGGLVLVQPVAGLLHRLDSSHQLQRLPCAVVCQT